MFRYECFELRFDINEFYTLWVIDFIQDGRWVIVKSLRTSSVNQSNLQYIPRNMHTVFALLCFVVVIHWLICPYPSGLLHWHCGNLTIAPVPAKQPWCIWINTSYEFIMNDCITTTKQSTTKPCAYFLGYTVCINVWPLTSLTHLGVVSHMYIMNGNPHFHRDASMRRKFLCSSYSPNGTQVR